MLHSAGVSFGGVRPSSVASQPVGQGATPIQKHPFAPGTSPDQDYHPPFFYHPIYQNELLRGGSSLPPHLFFYNIRMNSSPQEDRDNISNQPEFIVSSGKTRSSFFIVNRSLELNTARRPTERHDRSSVSILTEHLVFTPKFRGKVLQGRVAAECERTIRDVCKELDIKVIQIAVNPEHVHIQLQHPPKLSLSEIVGKLKANSSRELRRQFPHLKKWCKKALWSRGFFVISVGHDNQVVQRYIESQKTNHDSSGLKGSIGRLPNAIGRPDDTLNGGNSSEVN